MNSINLGLRFLLEMAALIAVGYWGWHQAEGAQQFILALGLPLVWMMLWGIFNVPDDPSRSGKAPVRVPGFVRLLLELVLFGVAVVGLFDAGLIWLSVPMAVFLIIHYFISLSRIKWLLKH